MVRTVLWLVIGGLLVGCDPAPQALESEDQTGDQAATELMPDASVHPPINVSGDDPVFSVTLEADGRYSIGGELVTLEEIGKICQLWGPAEPRLVLQLCGEEDVLFKGARTVVQTASEHDVHQVLFGGRTEQDAPTSRAWLSRVRDQMTESSGGSPAPSE